MKHMNAGGLRRAIAAARSSGFKEASALVSRTLAQHGMNGSVTPTGLQGAAANGPLQDKPIRRKPLHGSPLRPQHAKRLTFNCAAGTRDYVLNTPECIGKRANGLLLMLHGCTQTPEDFATGTRMNALADAHNMIIVYPAQNRGENAQSCWNWFNIGDQQHGRGEPAILAGLVQQIASAHEVPGDKVFAAGLSAGGAMAVILGQTYPDLFAGIAAHSGLPHGCAKDVLSAFAAMRGEHAATHKSKRGAETPTMVLHGSADTTVAPLNGDLIIRNALDNAAGQPVQTVTQSMAGGRRIDRVATTSATGHSLTEHLMIEGLGHAWSGGDRAGSYTDPAGPDASAEIMRFFLSLSRAGA